MEEIKNRAYTAEELKKIEDWFAKRINGLPAEYQVYLYGSAASGTIAIPFVNYPLLALHPEHVEPILGEQ